MAFTVLEKSPHLLLGLEEVKCFLRLHHDREDEVIRNLIRVAMDWVEECTGKTLLKKRLEYTHHNNLVFLPCGPVRRILSVRTRLRALVEGTDYKILNRSHTKAIEIPFRWRRQSITVTYEAGFGEGPEEVPLTLRQAVLSTVAYLYENRDAKLPLHPPVDPWIAYYRELMLQ